MRTVLFICTGNTCRSPMAEGIARQVMQTDPELAQLAGTGGMFFASAGISALDGMATTHETVEALRRRAIDYDSRSKRLTEQMIRKADHVVCMTASHRAAARALVSDSPVDIAKIVLLDPEGGDIDDPIGMGQREYDALAERMSRMIPARLRDVLKNTPEHTQEPPPPPPPPPATRIRRQT